MEYFLGGRRFGALTISSSLFVTAIAGMFAGQAAVGVWVGVVWSGVLAAFGAVLLGVFFVPLYVKAQVFTFPQFVRLRFDRQTALVWSGFSILYYVAVKMPLILAIASWAIVKVLRLGAEGSIGLILVVTFIGLYTVAGGYATVIRLQTIQASVVLFCSVGFLAFLIISPMTLSGPRSEVRLSDFGGGPGWMSAAVALPLVAAWHWLADQYVLQRIFSARTMEAAQKGSLLAALLIVVEVGIIAAICILGVNGASIDNAGLLASPMARALAGTFFLAVIMASLASDFHSAATLFTLDFYRAAVPAAHRESMVLTGRLVTTVVVVIAISIVATSSLLDTPSSLVLRQIEMNAAPPFIATFLLMLLWRRVSAKGIVWALILGEMLGIFHLVTTHLGYEGIPIGMYSGISFLATTIVLIVVSFLTAVHPLKETANIHTTEEAMIFTNDEEVRVSQKRGAS